MDDEAKLDLGCWNFIFFFKLCSKGNLSKIRLKTEFLNSLLKLSKVSQAFNSVTERSAKRRKNFHYSLIPCCPSIEYLSEAPKIVP